MGKNVKNFKGYNNSGRVNNGNNNSSNNNFGCNFSKNDVENDVKDQFNKYSGYSENQLIDEFYKEVYKQKQLGNLSPQMLENFYNMMAPQMSPSQKKKMKDLINSVK